MAQRTVLIPPTYDPKAFQIIISDLEKRLNKLESPIPQIYAVTDGTTTRSLDVTAATLLEVAQFLGTLVVDLQNAGKLGK